MSGWGFLFLCHWSQEWVRCLIEIPTLFASGCPKTAFSCNDWQRRYSADNCVPLSQRCDGIKQCANGKDEMDCNILTPSYIEGKNVSVEFLTKNTVWVSNVVKYEFYFSGVLYRLHRRVPSQELQGPVVPGVHSDQVLGQGCLCLRDRLQRQVLISLISWGSTRGKIKCLLSRRGNVY